MGPSMTALNVKEQLSYFTFWIFPGPSEYSHLNYTTLLLFLQMSRYSFMVSSVNESE